MSSIDIDTCEDVDLLKGYIKQLENENRDLKESYLQLSSRLSKVMPLIREQLADCDWDFSVNENRRVLDKSIDVVLKKKSNAVQGSLKLLDTMRIPRTSIYCCSFNSSGKFLACGCFNGCVVIYKYSASSNKIRHIRALTGHTGLVTSIMFPLYDTVIYRWIKGDDRIVTTSIDKTIRVWKPMTGEFETLIKTDMMIFNACLCVVNDNEVCAAVGSQKRFLFADIENSKIIRLMEHKSQISSIVEYKQYVITGDNAGDVMLINTSTYDCVGIVSRPNYQVKTMTVHKTKINDYYLAILYTNNTIEVFFIDVVEMISLSTYQIPELKTVSGNCSLIEDSTLLLSSVLSEAENIEEVEEKVIPNLYLIVGGITGMSYLWPVYRENMFQQPKIMKIHDNAINYLDFSSASSLVASCSKDHSLVLWKGI